MRPSNAAVLVAATVGVLCLLAGCSTPTGGATQLPPKNQSKWVLPLDEFSYTTAPLRDYAEALVERDCYAQKGIDWPVPWQPTDRNLGASVSAGGQLILDADLASKYGYHHAPADYANAAAWKTFTGKANQVADSTPNFETIMDACQAVSRKELPIPSNDSRDYAVAAASQIFSEAVLAKSVTKAAAAWAECMTKAGYGGLASSPSDMPPNDKAGQWNVGIPGTSAGPQEIAIASADVACRTSSGWTAALYDEEWKRQAEFVKENSGRLSSIRDEITKERKMLLDSVATHAPKQAG